jgi:hypothetical protein
VTSRRAAVGAVAAVIGASVAVWCVSSGPSSNELDEAQRDVVESLRTTSGLDAPAHAALMVDTNLAALLSAEVAAAVDGRVLADLFESALHYTARRDIRLRHVVSAVSEEGAIHSPGLRPVFADAVIDDLAWVSVRVNAPFEYLTRDMPSDVRETYYAVHDFLRDTMTDPGAAGALFTALNDYGAAQVASAPDAGEERAEWLTDIGVVSTVFTEAQVNADKLRASDDGDVDALAEAGASAKARFVGMLAAWLAADAYELDPAVRHAARGQPFVAPGGGLKPEMTKDDTEAFRAWARGLVAPGGLLRTDFTALGFGYTEVRANVLGLVLDGRY